MLAKRTIDSNHTTSVRQITFFPMDPVLLRITVLAQLIEIYLAPKRWRSYRSARDALMNVLLYIALLEP